MRLTEMFIYFHLKKAVWEEKVEQVILLLIKTTMTELQHIKNNSEEVSPDSIKSVILCKNGDIQVTYRIKGEKETWTGALIGIKLKKDGEVDYYTVYLY